MQCQGLVQWTGRWLCRQYVSWGPVDPSTAPALFWGSVWGQVAEATSLLDCRGMRNEWGKWWRQEEREEGLTSSTAGKGCYIQLQSYCTTSSVNPAPFIAHLLMVSIVDQSLSGGYYVGLDFLNINAHWILGSLTFRGWWREGGSIATSILCIQRLRFQWLGRKYKWMPLTCSSFKRNSSLSVIWLCLCKPWHGFA